MCQIVDKQTKDKTKLASQLPHEQSLAVQAEAGTSGALNTLMSLLEASGTASRRHAVVNHHVQSGAAANRPKQDHERSRLTDDPKSWHWGEVCLSCNIRHFSTICKHTSHVDMLCLGVAGRCDAAK